MDKVHASNAEFKGCANKLRVAGMDSRVPGDVTLTMCVAAVKLDKAAALLDVIAHSIESLRDERDKLRAELEAADDVSDTVCKQCGYEPGWDECVKCPIQEWRYRDEMPLSEIANTPAQGATDERGGGEDA